MTYCFAFAMGAEAEPLFAQSTLENEERFGFAKFYRLSYQGKMFFILVSGIGKVLAASALSAAISAHPEIDAVINVGIGGSLDANVAPLLSAVLGEKFAQHDMDTTCFGDPQGYLNGLDTVYLSASEDLLSSLQEACGKVGVPYAKATIASGDRFITDEKEKDAIAKRFGALLIDMETAAFAEVCHVYHKPFSCLRIVSDAVDHYNEYVRYKPLAIETACKVALALL